MYNFLVCAYKSQDFAQSQENFAQSHDRETMTFRNSGPRCTKTSRPGPSPPPLKCTRGHLSPAQGSAPYRRRPGRAAVTGRSQRSWPGDSHVWCLSGLAALPRGLAPSQADHDVVLPILLLAWGGASLVDCLVEQADHGVAVGEGTQESGDPPDPVFHDHAFLIHKLILGQHPPPEQLLADYPGKVSAGEAQADHVLH